MVRDMVRHRGRGAGRRVPRPCRRRPRLRRRRCDELCAHVAHAAVAAHPAGAPGPMRVGRVAGRQPAAPQRADAARACRGAGRVARARPGHRARLRSTVAAACLVPVLAAVRSQRARRGRHLHAGACTWGGGGGGGGPGPPPTPPPPPPTPPAGPRGRGGGGGGGGAGPPPARAHRSPPPPPLPPPLRARRAAPRGPTFAASPWRRMSRAWTPPWSPFRP
jgi:hypothetical protein